MPRHMTGRSKQVGLGLGSGPSTHLDCWMFLLLSTCIHLRFKKEKIIIMKSLLGAVPLSQGAVSLSTQINREVFLFLFLIKGRHAPVSTGKKNKQKRNDNHRAKCSHCSR